MRGGVVGNKWVCRLARRPLVRGVCIDAASLSGVASARGHVRGPAVLGHGSSTPHAATQRSGEPAAVAVRPCATASVYRLRHNE